MHGPKCSVDNRSQSELSPIDNYLVVVGDIRQSKGYHTGRKENAVQRSHVYGVGMVSDGTLHTCDRLRLLACPYLCSNSIILFQAPPKEICFEKDGS